jgi:hypothetical protein
VLRDLGLEDAKEVTTPGTKEEANKALKENGCNVSVLRWHDQEEEVGEGQELLLSGSEATKF